MWTKQSYGKTLDPDTLEWKESGGHWTISNGHIQFDVHILLDAGGRKAKYPDGNIVNTAEANAYADKFIEVLNRQDMINFQPRIR